jgi:hypothetical protein
LRDSNSTIGPLAQNRYRASMGHLVIGYVTIVKGFWKRFLSGRVSFFGAKLSPAYTELAVVSFRGRCQPTGEME